VKRRARAGEGIPLWDYIKFHVPETFVRAQLDRGELRYTWTDTRNTARASDDGEELPPRGWWLSDLTRIDEWSSVRGHALFGPVFPMDRVRVYPAGATAKLANPKGGRKRRAVGGGRKWRQVRDVLPKLTDRDGKVLYPDGKVPDSVSTKTVLLEVIAALGYDVNWNGWHTVNRALGREREK
jgi:hypothetical protein